jgi:hypothetical protein
VSFGATVGAQNVEALTGEALRVASDAKRLDVERGSTEHGDPKVRVVT